jgi:hypothetical protein
MKVFFHIFKIVLSPTKVYLQILEASFTNFPPFPYYTRWGLLGRVGGVSGLLDKCMTQLTNSLVDWLVCWRGSWSLPNAKAENRMGIDG